MTHELKLHWSGGALNLAQDNPDIFGYFLENWNPSSLPDKSGGIVMDSPIADGSRPVARFYGVVDEIINLQIKGVDQNNAILLARTLRKAVNEALNYWITNQISTPVYLSAKAYQEDNTRYAVVLQGDIPDDPNPYEQPFMGENGEALMEVALGLTHGPWTDTAPGSDTGFAISNSEAYGGNTFGHAATTAEEVYLGNRMNVVNLTHIFTFDTSAGTYSSNLVASSTFTYLPDSQQVGDIVYFGIEDIDNMVPFSSLIFDSNGQVTADYTAAWQYYNGAWTSLPGATIRDYTDDLKNSGVITVAWEQPSDWTDVAVNGVTGLWVRLRISAVTTQGKANSQQNRLVYAANWNYVDVATDVIGGDLFGRLRVRLGNAGANPPTLQIDRILVGSRRVSRGSNFYPRWYISNGQDRGNTITAILGALVDDPTTGGGAYWRRLSATTTSFTSGLRFDFDNVDVQEYTGRYRLFVVAGGLYGDEELKVIVYQGQNTITVYEASRVITNTNQEQAAWDFGEFEIGYPHLAPDLDFTNLRFLFQYKYPNGSGGDLRIFEFWLVPVDEYAGEFVNTDFSQEFSTSGGEPEVLELDSTLMEKAVVRSFVYDVSSDKTVEGVFRTNTKRPINLSPDANQRLWFFCMRRSGGIFYSDPEALLRVQAFVKHQYFSMRGAN